MMDGHEHMRYAFKHLVIAAGNPIAPLLKKIVHQIVQVVMMEVIRGVAELRPPTCIRLHIYIVRSVDQFIQVCTEMADNQGYPNGVIPVDTRYW